MSPFLSGNRHPTVTQTGHPNRVPRKLFSLNRLRMRRAGIEPATYRFKGISLSKLIRGFPRRILSETVRIARKARESVLGNRNANVIANPRIGHSGPAFLHFRFSPEGQRELERTAREEERRFAFRRHY